MSVVTRFNKLSGKVSRLTLTELQTQAKQEHVFEIDQRIKAILLAHPKSDDFEITSVTPKIIAAERSSLCGLEHIENDAQLEGLGKSVSPNDVYDMVTKKVLAVINSKNKLPWTSPWKSVEKYGFPASNFVSKKPYRGINAILLHPDMNPQREPFDIPYFLTFKQIQKLKGRLKKGSKGFEVVYFTTVYQYDQDNVDGKISFRTSDIKKFINWAKRNKSKISILKSNIGFLQSFISNCTIPILKYYNIFNADDIDGIDWGITVLDPKKEIEKIEIADKIFENYPNPPSYEEKGSRAYYVSKPHDMVVMPQKSKVKSIERFYSIKAHEFIHSTGHKSRLNRKLGSKFGSREYSFEELIAEMGASFLNAESGILYHNIKHSASYLKDWKDNLKEVLTDDNRFFFRASSKAQAAADHILNRNAKGVPAYKGKLQPKAKLNRSKKNKPPVRTKKQPKQLSFQFKGLSGFSPYEYSWKDSEHYDSTYNEIFKKFNKAYGSEVKKFTTEIKNDTIFQEDLEKAIPQADINQQNAIFLKLREDQLKKESIVSKRVQINKDLKFIDRVLKLTPKEFETEIRTGKIAKVKSNPKPKKLTAKELARKKKIAEMAEKEIAEELGKKRKSNSKPGIIGKMKSKLRLNGIEPIYTNELVKSITQLEEVNNSLPNNVFEIRGEIAQLLGTIEVKPIHSVAITLDAPEGSGKTRHLLQTVNTFAEAGYKCLIASLEEHPQSTLFLDKVDQYISEKAKSNIGTIGELPDWYNTLDGLIPHYDVIFVDSWNKIAEKSPGVDFDNDLRKRHDGKLFYCIFQRTVDGSMRGGAKAGFDGDIILKVNRFEDFRENEVYNHKNRYNSRPLTEFSFNIFKGKIKSK